MTTHSSHILYERGFKPIRYFRRCDGQRSEVINLSAFYQQSQPKDRDFLERYLKITHCDLFFADAAILVEGNVERLLMPLFIVKSAPRLTGSFLTVLEVGGAYGHRFKSLIEFLGITSLVITDIDSVEPIAVPATGTVVAGEEVDDEIVKGEACQVDAPGAVTCNQTLIQWLPGKTTISDLLAATEVERIQNPTAASRSIIRVCYQTRRDATWGNVTLPLAGRTLEETFALENLVWCQHKDRKELGLRIRSAATFDLAEMSKRLFTKVQSSGFNKTNFALALMYENKESWSVPHYIDEGLCWLADRIGPAAVAPAAPGATAAGPIRSASQHKPSSI